MQERNRCLNGIRAQAARLRVIGQLEIADTIDTYVADLRAELGIGDSQKSCTTRSLFEDIEQPQLTGA